MPDVSELFDSDASEATVWSVFDFSGVAGWADCGESDEAGVPVSAGFWVGGFWVAAG